MHADPAPMSRSLAPAAPGAMVGVFDSGVGGLSVLRALHRALPAAPLVYLADSGFAPYGQRGDAFVRERSLAIAEHLLDRGAAAIVVACNTATAAAIDTMRARWPDVPFVGVEPGVKPAATLTRNGRIGVLATPGTLSSPRFERLVAQQAAGRVIVPRPCPDLAALIEGGDVDDPALAAAVGAHCAVLREHGVDTVVLGCTHYTFVHHLIQQAMGEAVTIVDTADAVARHAGRRIAAPGVATVPRPLLLTTADDAHLAGIARRWLPFDVDVAPVQI